MLSFHKLVRYFKIIGGAKTKAKTKLRYISGTIKFITQLRHGMFELQKVLKDFRGCLQSTSNVEL